MHLAKRLALSVALMLITVGCGSGERPTLIDVDSAEPQTLVVDEGPSRSAELDSVDDPDGQVVVSSSAANAEAEVQSDGGAGTSDGAASRVPLVVYDTDFGPDIDDVLALAMLHAYQDQGMIELAAVTVSHDKVLGARFADAVNTFYGRPDVPIGLYRGPMEEVSLGGTFAALADRWPNDVADGEIPDGHRVQRQVLVEAAQQGRQVLFIQTGFSGNQSRLLDSGGDDISPEIGRQLVADNVSMLSIMAGTNGSFIEFNVEHDVASARNVISNWPGLLVQSPHELGYGVLYPYSSIRNDLAWTDRHPVREAYEYRDLQWHHDAPPYYDMRTWDLTSVLYAVEPDSGHFVVSRGTVTIDGSGRTYFGAGDGPHLQLAAAGRHSDDQRQAMVNRMIELVSHRPANQ